MVERVETKEAVDTQDIPEVVKADEIDTASIARWELPKMEVDSEHVIHFASENERKEHNEAQEDEEEPVFQPTEQQINEWKQELKQQIYDEAYAEGHQQGMQAAEQEIAAAQAETQALQQKLRDIIQHLDAPLEKMNHEVEQQIELLAVSLAQQLVRREIKNDSGQIVGLIRDSIALLPAASRKIKITIHPDDSQIIKEALSLDMDDADFNWTLIEDPMMTAGGCIIKSDQSVINATVENRLASLAASVLSGDREADEANQTQAVKPAEEQARQDDINVEPDSEHTVEESEDAGS